MHRIVGTMFQTYIYVCMYSIQSVSNVHYAYVRYRTDLTGLAVVLWLKCCGIV